MPIAPEETLRVVQSVHDTVRVVVRDTVVLVAESRALDRWVTLAAGLATVFTAAVAFWGVRAWRHQLKGATEYRLAIRMYRAVLRLRDHIRAAREPFNHLLPVYEGESDKNTPEFVEREREEYWGWFREVIKSTLVLKALRPEVEMHWGFEATKHIDSMEERARTLRGNYKAYFQAQLRALRGETGYAEVVESSRKVLFNLKLTEEDRDEYGEALDAVIEDARAFLKRKIDLTK